jgi:hypothetical protein
VKTKQSLVGIDEADFLRATQGTCTLGMNFCDWLEPGQDDFHAFGQLGDHWPERIDPVVVEIPFERAGQALQVHRRAIEATVERMPHHHQLLKQVTG